MLRSVTPFTLLADQVHAMRCQIPGVRDGRPDAVHDARVTTRRIRQLLSLVGDGRSRHADDLRARFRRLGRSLGRVRDADVRTALLTLLESRVPHASPALAILRQDRERERQKLMRKLIKRFERLDVDQLLYSLADDVARGLRLWSWAARSHGSWRRLLRHTLAERAQTTSDAIVHATGVYFPRRTHEVRIAVKKLRYALEIANAVEAEDVSVAIRDLKKTQDLLGEIHDRQDLMDQLDADAIGRADGEHIDASHQVNLIHQVLEAECRRLHERYLERRVRLLAICAEQRVTPHTPSMIVTVPIVAASALALSSGIYMARRRARPAIAG